MISLKQRYWVFLVLILLMAIGAIIWQSLSPTVATFQQERVLRFTYELANTTNRALKDVQFSTYLPVIETSNQSSEDVITTNQFELESSSGNRIAKFDIDLIPPFGKKKISYTAVVKTAEYANQLPVADIDVYLKQEKFIEIQNKDIASLANKLRGTTDFDSAEKIYKWVSSRIKDSGYTSQDKGAVYALNNLKGDCTEHMYLTIALARAIGIPARAVGGFVYKKNSIVESADYHNWAELYIDDTWHILDTQKKSFMENTQDYIAMRMISSPDASLLGSSHRFLVATDGVQVSMK